MLLRGSEIAGYIKQRHFQQVKSWQYLKTAPKLAIVCANEEVVSSKYIGLKRKYGEDVGIVVEIHQVSGASGLEARISALNRDASVHGIIVQLPLPSPIEPEKILNTVTAGKDVDGLSKDSKFDPATPTAILWLLSSYDINLHSKTITIIGQGKLVGAPLTRMLQASGYEPVVCDINTKDIFKKTLQADIVITATGQPGLVTEGMIKPGAVVIDAGTADVEGVLAGDVNPTLYERNDIKVTPVPGGVGPLTVCALFENLLTAYKNQVILGK